VIVLWPHSRLWDVARHAPWLKEIVIGLSFVCALFTAIAVIAVWFRPTGLRCVVSIAGALVGTVIVSKGIAHLVHVDRPFVTHDFTPLFPHTRSTSFPSTLTAYFAIVAAPMLFAWRRLGWIMVSITGEVAVACVYVGVHYGTDVVAGAIIGGGSGAFAWFLLGLPPFESAIGRIDRVLIGLHLRPA
jgi:membrane-associated phospholipid phosphatase